MASVRVRKNNGMFVLVFLACCFQVSASNFKATWRTTFDKDRIFFDVRSPNLTISWGDGDTEFFNTSSIAHTYIKAGDYNMTISGTIKQFELFVGAPKLIDISDWGDFEIGPNDSYMFSGCIYLRVSASNQPRMLPNATLVGMFADTQFNSPLSWDLTNVVSLASMFDGAAQFNQPLNFSNTNNVTSVNRMFAGATSFNQPVSFDTRNVINMASMFLSAKQFNQPLNFQTQNVVNMGSMFSRATSFNQPVNFSNTSNVQSMNSMFSGAVQFNQPLNFQTQNVVDMEAMFFGATSFNQPVNFSNTSNVQSMRSMFSGATQFDQPLNFQTQNVVYMMSMFSDAIQFNQPVNFSDSSQVISVSNMFSGAKSFNQPINLNAISLQDAIAMFAGAIAFNNTVNLANSFNLLTISQMFKGATSFNQPVNFSTGNVKNMFAMFASATQFNQPLNFDTSNCQNMSSMFQNASSFNQPINFSDTSQVMSMDKMFASATQFNHPIDFNATSLVRAESMFAGATAFNSSVSLADSFSLASTVSMFDGARDFNQPISLNTSYVADMSRMFASAAAFNQPVNFDTQHVGTVRSMFQEAITFNQPVIFVNTRQLESMRNMFAGATSFNQPITFDADDVTDMIGVFQSATSFNQVINFSASSLIDADSMFAGASAFNSPVSLVHSIFLRSTVSMFQGAVSFNQALSLQTNNVLDMTSMFEGASSFNQTLANFDTSKVTQMRAMFASAINFNRPVNFDTRSVEQMDSMFHNASSFNQPVNFNTGRVESMESMFALAKSFNQPVAFDTRQVASMSNMFASATTFNQPVNFDTRKVTNMNTMFRNAIDFNQPVSFNTNQVTSMNEMFAFASQFNQTVIFSSVANVTDMTSMFANVSRGFEQDLGSWNTSLVASCSQFCYSCGLPTFPQCQPCAPGSRLHRLNPSMDVCNCPHNDCNGQVSIPLNGSALTVVLVDPSNNRSTATVYIPAGGIFHNRSLVAAIHPGPNAALSNSVVSLLLQSSNGQLVNVSNLRPPVSIIVELRRPLDPTAVSQCEGTSYVVAPVLPTCGFLNESNNNEWETSGCSVASFNSTHVQCNCTHFTLFAALSPKHNKLVPTAVLALSPANVSANPTGLVSVLVLLCLFAVVFVVAALRDRAERAEYEQLRLAKREKWDNFVAENKRTTLWKQVKIAFQKRHTWFSLVFRKSGTSFKSVDRTFVTLLMVFVSMSASAFYHAQDNNDIARVVAIMLSVLVIVVPCQLLVLLFVRTGPIGFYEEWEQSRKPPQTNKCLRYRFPDHWRYVWRVGTLLVVIGLMIFVLIMSMNFDRQPFYFCRGQAALAWVSTWLATYAVSVFLVEPLRIVLLALAAYYRDTLRVPSSVLFSVASSPPSPRELASLDSPRKHSEEETNEEDKTE